MEELISEEENRIEEEIISDFEDEWKISYCNEKLFWQQIVIPSLIYAPTLCPYCKKQTIRIAEKKKYILH